MRHVLRTVNCFNLIYLKKNFRTHFAHFTSATIYWNAMDAEITFLYVESLGFFRFCIQFYFLSVCLYTQLEIVLRP